MSVVITSDLHFSGNHRDAYRLDFLRKLPSVLKQQKAALLLVLGDLTEAKDAHSAELVNVIVDGFHSLAQVCPVVLLQGNHDWLSSPQNAYFKFLEKFPGIHWVGTPTLASQLHDILGDAIFLPHSANPDRDWKHINFRQFKRAFAHQTFTGALGENGQPLTGIALDMFPKNLKIISGDVHTPQRVGNITYVGSPYHIDFGDSYKPRMLVIDNNGKETSMPCNGPQKQLLRIKSVVELNKQQQQLNPGDVLKVVVELAPHQYAEWPQIAAQVRAWGNASGYTVHAVQPLVETNPVKKSGAQKEHTAKPDKELIQEYASIRSLDLATTNAGLKLIN